MRQWLSEDVDESVFVIHPCSRCYADSDKMQILDEFWFFVCCSTSRSENWSLFAPVALGYLFTCSRGPGYPFMLAPVAPSPVVCMFGPVAPVCLLNSRNSSGNDSLVKLQYFSSLVIVHPHADGPNVILVNESVAKLVRYSCLVLKICIGTLQDRNYVLCRVGDRRNTWT